MGTEPYEPIHIALCFTLLRRPPSSRASMLQSCSTETLARMLAVFYSVVYEEHKEFTPDDREEQFTISAEVMGMLISKLDTSGEPF